MTENNSQPQQAANGAAEPKSEKPAPRLSIQTQYIKDLSFENPTPSRTAAKSDSRPQIQIKVDVRAKQLGGDRYEIELELGVDAKMQKDNADASAQSPVETSAETETVFVLELVYGGVFVIANIPQETLQPVLMVECPRLLFPFARRVVADMTRDGGFPPLMIDPIDFVALFRQRVQRAQASAEAKAASETGSSTA